MLLPYLAELTHKCCEADIIISHQFIESPKVMSRLERRAFRLQIQAFRFRTCPYFQLVSVGLFSHSCSPSWSVPCLDPNIYVWGSLTKFQKICFSLAGQGDTAVAAPAPQYLGCMLMLVHRALDPLCSDCEYIPRIIGEIATAPDLRFSIAQCRYSNQLFIQAFPLVMSLHLG